VAELYTGVDGSTVYVDSGETLSGSTATLTDRNGNWSLDLEPNELIVPDGTVWRVRVTRPGGSLLVDDYITVPDSYGPHEFVDLLTEPPGALPSSATLAQISDIDAGRDFGYSSADLQAAIDLGVSTGRRVYLRPGVYSGDGVSWTGKVNIFGAGPGITEITVSGASGLYYQSTEGTFDYAQRHESSLSGVSIVGVASNGSEGNSTAGAAGLTISDCVGFAVRDCWVRGFTNGSAIRLFNNRKWTELTEISRVAVSGCLTGVEFLRDMTLGGTNSFGYTKILSIHVNVPEDGQGIDVGSDGDAAVLYNATVYATMHLDDGATGMVVRSGSSVWNSTAVRMLCENEPGVSDASSTKVVSADGECQMQGIVRGTPDQVPLAGSVMINGVSAGFTSGDVEFVSSTSPANVAGLVAYMPAYSYCRLEALIAYEGPASTDLAYDVAVPSGTTGWVVGAAPDVAASGTAVNLVSSVNTVSQGSTQFAGSIANNVMAVLLSGMIRAGASGGNVYIRGAQRVSGGTPITVKSKSYLQLTRIDLER